ncbi:ABC-three component system protein [Synergistes jonesii]|uniref:ABC-three component systems C-terminal domain-containing protein n=1 Tax=Synergistes jonesii TaxID=2754 RepID=A0A073J0B9_9BACT|nr:ABC-three component system protein [Synergistes jonesii]KEJ91102.1 hypothetical protein EH55_13040 [Synergistes jonesii]
MSTHIMERQIRDYFELRVHQKSGVEFQEFFSDIMIAIDSRFIKIASYRGDGGNDGCITEEKRYYQVYAPAPSTSQQTVSQYAVQKLNTDYNKLKKHWGPVEHFHFVLNDHMRGIDPNVVLQLTKIKDSDPNLQTADPIGMDRLYKMFSQLQQDKQMLIIEYIPLDGSGIPNHEYLKNILTHFLNMQHRSNVDSPLVSPKLEEKIRSNGLTQKIRDRILENSKYVSDVEDYFVSSPDEEQKIAALLRRIYCKVIDEVHDYSANAPDIRYHEMIRSMLPSDVKDMDLETQKSYYYAAEIIFTKYFESCDVFEPPFSPDSQ